MSEVLPSTLPWLLTLWVAVGAAVAWWLASRGQPQALAWTALVAWPFLVPLLGADPPPASRPAAVRGPLADRIDAALDQLVTALAGPEGEAVPAEALEGLRRVLREADARLGWVDRLLREDDAAPADVRRRLQGERARALGRLEEVVAEVAALRLQVGLRILSGDTPSIARRLAELRARVDALDEVDRLPAGGA